MNEQNKGRLIGTLSCNDGTEVKIHYGDQVFCETWGGNKYSGTATDLEDDCIYMQLVNGKEHAASCFLVNGYWVDLISNRAWKAESDAVDLLKKIRILGGK